MATGVAAILSHVIDGIERLVTFASPALTKSERNYSQLDRKAVAIIFALNKFYTYIYGRRFTLINDNKALTRIFHETAKLPAMTSGCLLRYPGFLSRFDYTIKHRKAAELVNVDFLSRVEHTQGNATVNRSSVKTFKNYMITS